jgi:taurine dioxygenase
MGSVLYMLETPSCGGDTLFASMYAAYDRLSDPIKQLIDGLTAIHDGEASYHGRFGHAIPEGGFPRAEHPVVRTHPVTGKKALFVNGNFTMRINGLSKLESDALLQMLCRHAETPEFQCRFHWQPNSVAFWDNRCAQHHALWDYYPHRRHGYRVMIEGDRRSRKVPSA